MNGLIWMAQPCPRVILKNRLPLISKKLCLGRGWWMATIQSLALHKKWSFSLRISSVNVTKSAGKCRFGHIYWGNPSWETLFFVQCSFSQRSFIVPRVDVRIVRKIARVFSPPNNVASDSVGYWLFVFHLKYWYARI